MRTIIKLTVFIFVISGALSCSSDKGNYNYREPLEITVSIPKTEYLVQQFTDLRIEPVITYYQGKTDTDFDFCWIIRDIGVNGPLDTLSNQKILDVEIVNSVDTYDLYVFMTEKSTGRVYSAGTELTVENSLTSGTMVLSNVDGYAEVSFINSFETVLPGIFSSTNGFSVGKNPRKIEFLAVERHPYGIYGVVMRSIPKTIFIACDDEETGGYVADPIDFSALYPMSEAYIFAPDKYELGFIAVSTLINMDVIINDGKAYTRVITGSDPYPAFGLPVPQGNFSDDYYLAPLISATITTNIFFFDNIGKQFLYGVSVDNASLQKLDSNFYTSNGSANIFNPADLGLNLVSWGVTYGSGFYETMVMVMEDDNGELYLLSMYINQMQSSQMEDFLVPQGKVKLSDISQDLATASHFAFYREMNIVYAANGNKIHSYRHADQILSGSYDIPLQSGERVTYMEGDLDNDLLYVCIGDGTNNANNGSLLIYRATATGELELQKTYRNMFGNIVDVSTKVL